MGIIKMKRRDCRANRARNDTAPPPRLPSQGGGYKRGFTLIEMLTTTAILVIVFGLLAIIFGRATNIHKIVRSGGDAENLGIYLINTIIYGPGIERGKGLVGAKPFICELDTSSSDATCPDTLTFRGNDGQPVRYILDGDSMKYQAGGGYVDLKPTWATDRQLEVVRPTPGLNGSKFYYYGADGITETADGLPVYYVGISLVLKNTLQNLEEAVTLYRCVRVRNQIDF